MIKVIVADKQPAFRASLCRALARCGDMQAAAQTGDGEELLELCARIKPEAAVIDIALPKINAIDATKKLKNISPQTSVLVLSAVESQTLALSALRAGAAGYLSRSTPPADLIKALRLIQAGEGIIERGLGESIIRNAANENENPARRPAGLDLHPRELEVLKQAARGLRNKEIALALGISERTVQTHLSNIYSKLAVDSRAEAVLKALREGSLDVDDLR